MTTIPERIREEADAMLRMLDVYCSCPTCRDVAAQALQAAEKRGREEAAKIAREYPLTDIYAAHSNRSVAFNVSQNIADIIDGKLFAKITLEGDAYSATAIRTERE